MKKVPAPTAPAATAEMELLAEALLHHDAFPLATALRRALRDRGEYVPDEEEELLWNYTDRIFIERMWAGFRFVTRDDEPLLCIGPLQVFEESISGMLRTRCRVWYGSEALREWQRQEVAARPFTY
ncbi:hypothetical protein ACFQT0_30290 [Hymenobacter humi]|uniref:Uncharacterized protein n=1 Tax=Hymenobacter humi TaxID=1411620 RepID=A0ABW2UCJ3_9BACT